MGHEFGEGLVLQGWGWASELKRTGKATLRRALCHLGCPALNADCDISNGGRGDFWIGDLHYAAPQHRVTIIMESRA